MVLYGRKLSNSPEKTRFTLKVLIFLGYGLSFSERIFLRWFGFGFGSGFLPTHVNLSISLYTR